MASYPATDLSLSTTITIASQASISTPIPATPATIEPDTVHLSQSAQVLLLSQQGQSASQIGGSLGLTTAEVDADLGEVMATILATAAPAAAVADSANGSTN